MKKKLIISIFSLLLISNTITAQRKHKQTKDSLEQYREFARLGQWYLKLPLAIDLHFIHSTFPASISGDHDSTETDAVLYYGKNDFYLKAEGLEQIANDSLMVLVNHEAKMIKVYSNTGQLLNNLQKSVQGLMPDSSLQKLAQRYAVTTENGEKNVRRITLFSRDKISGTNLFKETISVMYRADTYEPLSVEQSRRILLPVDSTVYQSILSENITYKGRLITAKANAGNLYFLVRDQNTVCRFARINHDLATPPLREQDRVLREADGTYRPVKGFEDYVVSREW